MENRMTSQVQQLIGGGFSTNLKKQVRRSSSARVKRGSGFSASRTLDEESDRIMSYIPEDILRGVIDKESAEEALKTLLQLDGFDNLLDSTSELSESKFRKRLIKDRIDVLRNAVSESSVTLKSGKERVGYKIDDEKYFLLTKNNILQVREFKTGRNTKIRRSELIEIVEGL